MYHSNQFIKSEINMKNIFKIKLFIFLSIFGLACTDLEETILDETLNEDLITDEGFEEGLLAAVYAPGGAIYTDYREAWGLQELCTDEAIIPTRVTDWDDNGTYRDLHLFTWTPTHSLVNRTWNSLAGGVARSIQAVSTIQSSSTAPLRNQYIAEARSVGAVYMLSMLDLYGVILYRNPEGLNFADDPQVMRGSEAVQFLIQEFEESIEDLPGRSSGGLGQGRMTKEAAQGFLARIYLNKAVYENPYAGSFSFSAGDMEQVIDQATAVINSGAHRLETEDYFAMFDVDNNNHPEHVFVIDQRTEIKIGSNRLATVTYSRGHRPTPGVRPWNGACTTADFLNTWDGNTTDPRYYKEVFAQDGSVTELPSPDFTSGDFFRYNRGFQEGQQYGPFLNNEGNDFTRVDGNPDMLEIAPLTNFRDDNLVNHTRDLDDIFTTQAAGVRVFKYEFDPALNSASRGGVDIPVLRYADIYLMRAEAKLRNGDIGGAVEDINIVRAARGADLLTTIDLQGMYNERGYELYWEQVRRTDMIRFETFDNARLFKAASDPSRRVFPIPQTALDVNPDLEQNQGY